ncbi:MAG: hypothetical protein KFF50_10555 [Desulfatitalea sp.]|nr:hypothetical protein [Desulfatitalea sp.]
MTDEIAISGIKISPPALALQLRTDSATSDLTPRLCRLLTIARVNIAFMTAIGQAPHTYTLCCIDPDQREKVTHMVDQDAQLKASITYGSVLGLLTLYPHRGSLQLLGLAVQALSDAGIAIYGLASSIAALTVAIDFSRLEEAAALLAERFDLPRNPPPVQPGITVRQEKRIR